ncbi:MAG: hypothetical protein KDK60_02395 [Chlamydiia bacterium]|nr:hypothetical protein [Chlamydiia bacterium]
MKKSHYFLILSLAFTSLFSNQMNGCKATIEDISTKNVFCDWQGKVPSASVDSGFFADLSFLYLKPEIEGLSLGQNLDSDTSQLPLQVSSEIKVEELNFKWKPGVKAGFGYTIPQREQWEVSAYWTYMHSSADRSLSKPEANFGGDNIVPSSLPYILGPGATRASGDWRLNFNLIDLAIARNAFFGRFLSLKPMVGIRFAWIYQNYLAKYRGGFTSTDTTSGISSTIFQDTRFKGKNNFWAGGVRLGSDFDWYLSKNISIVGNIFFSLLYGKFDIKENYSGAVLVDLGSGVQTLNQLVEVTFPHNTLRSAIESEIGLRWHRFFNGNNSRLLIGLFYQFNVWFDQNELLNHFVTPNSGPIDATNINSSNLIANINPKGDLMMQGLRVQCRYDF